MKTSTHLFIHIIILALLNGGNIVKAGQATPEHKADSTIKVLRLTRISNRKVEYFAPGMEIIYWDVRFTHKVKHQGILKGFSGDSLMIDDETRALSSIYRIKKPNKPLQTVGKVFGWLAIFSLGSFSALLGIGMIWEGWVGPGIGVLVGAGGFFTATYFIGKKRGKIPQKYQAEIVEIPVSELKK